MRDRFVMTHFGEPEPWTPEAVQVYLAKVRNEIETGGFHAYTVMKRVWGESIAYFEMEIAG